MIRVINNDSLVTVYLCIYYFTYLNIRWNNTRENLNRTIKNNPCPSSFYYSLHQNITLLVFDCYYLSSSNSYLNCFTVELYSTGLQVGQCFFPRSFLFFFPTTDCPDDWWQLCGVGVSCHCLRSFFLHSLIILFSLLFHLYVFDKPPF